MHYRYLPSRASNLILLLFFLESFNPWGSYFETKKTRARAERAGQASVVCIARQPHSVHHPVVLLATEIPPGGKGPKVT